MRVRAMFRVLRVIESCENVRSAEMAPTLKTRDGQPCEENEKFWQTTPSGAGDVQFRPAPERQKLFDLLTKGEYVYLSFYKLDEAPPVPEDAVRLHYVETEYTVDQYGGFRVSMQSLAEPNFEATGMQWNAGNLSMSIKNQECEAFFAMSTRTTGSQRRIVVDFSKA